MKSQSPRELMSPVKLVNCTYTIHKRSRSSPEQLIAPLNHGSRTHGMLHEAIELLYTPFVWSSATWQRVLREASEGLEGSCGASSLKFSVEYRFGCLSRYS